MVELQRKSVQFVSQLDNNESMLFLLLHKVFNHDVKHVVDAETRKFYIHILFKAILLMLIRAHLFGGRINSGRIVVEELLKLLLQLRLLEFVEVVV